MVAYAFFGGFVVKKVTVAMLAPSSFGVVLCIRRWLEAVFFFFFFFCGAFSLIH